ncbi:MAG: preprotein translocase subunit SecG [Lautropia sp.]|nr:preprotein translocase subunit SecG [Lautropia sp.]MCL4701156.1 preprotein translocase subunit SecG [Burkholderiaceae bacterium]MCZ2412685.1 preprotein translocase subunit SecG [Burkholderiales bacterium]MDL1909005.1 preprotein translocase subunit SecG [Betaproteobacteria bacterium PRO1]RIK88543.1 MAG: preprotein translocase subunit SecG [Burkholderiales bacterium]
MNWLTSLLMTVQVIAAFGVIVLVLLQHGKGADMGAAFGGGASGSLFGASGSANFLSRSTAALAALFFITTLALAFLGHRSVEAPASVMERAPAAPVDAGAPRAPSDIPSAGAEAPAGAGAPAAAPAVAPDAGQAPGQAAPKNGAASDIPK